MALIEGSGLRDARGPPALLCQHRLAVLVDPENFVAVWADDFVHVSLAPDSTLLGSEVEFYRYELYTA